MSELFIEDAAQVLLAQDITQFFALMHLSHKIGQTPNGGLNRLCASKEDGQMRDAFVQWLTAHHFQVKIDAVGNIFGCMQFAADLDYVLCGSHLDTQPYGGKYDGVYGVVAAAVAISSIARHLQQQQIKPQFNLAVVSWCNEEGARFQPSLLGSSVFAGQISLQQAWACTDSNGISLQQSLDDIGYLGTADLHLAVKQYFELHIEQGLQLSHHGAKIGLVGSIWAARKLKIQLRGEQNHTGPTPMHLRKDALWAAAQLIVFIRHLADRYPDQLHTSVGKMDTYPNSPNIVCSRVELYIELRCQAQPLLSSVGTEIYDYLHTLDAACQTQHQILSDSLRENDFFDPQLIDHAEKIVRQQQLPYLKMSSISGHDAVSLNKIVPSCLVFVPSENGVSHSEQEYTSDEDLVLGLRFLTALLASVALQA
jgi:N-carbamoyl-L-amino-acid hydrolase